MSRQLNCAPIIWMFCTMTQCKKVQSTYQKTLKVNHDDDESNDDHLKLSKEVSLTITVWS